MILPYRLHYAPDNASLIVRLVLEELRIPYDTVLVDRAANAQCSPAFLALNPNGLIPVLETPVGPIHETGAILLWLADTHSALAPVPNDPPRAAFLKWLFWVSNTLHADLRILFYPGKFTGPDLSAQTALRTGIRQRLRGHLDLLEAVAGEAPPWLTPDKPTVVNFYVACLLRWMALYPADADRSWLRLADTPHLHRLLTSLETRASTRAAQAAEGLGDTPFTNPTYATPPEGSAT